jgi:redox-sensitive bicupin YhaK (pirin superfamily)
MNTASVTTPRQIERLVVGRPTTEGAGVKLTRVLTNDLQQRLDPFLMLDNFASDKADDYIAGFPNHPHRGFETVTYMIAGRMRHRDSAGHEGLLQNGGVQWMTAGRGLVHSELPEQEEGLMEGFQLWLNLPARDKMREPGYRDIPTEEIPEALTPEGVKVRVIAGQSQGVSGAMVRPLEAWPTDTLYLDLHFSAGGGTFQHALPAHYNAFLYTYRGQVRVGNTEVPSGRMGLLDNTGNGVVIEALPGDTPARVLLIAGQPLNEPIAQYGPFVMNTREELIVAVDDFQAGRFV